MSNRSLVARLMRSTLLSGAALVAPVSAASSWIACATGLVTLIAVAPARAQDVSVGTLDGRVLDNNGKPIPNAEITITSPTTGLERRYTTSSDGRFKAIQLPTGSYDIVVKRDGYQSTRSEGVLLAAGGSAYEFDLKAVAIDTASQEILVTAPRRALSFNAATVGLTVDLDDLKKQIPLGRDLSAVALLSPTAALGDGRIADRQGRNLVSLGGASVAENVYYLNGVNVTDIRQFLGGSQPPFEFIGNVEIKEGGYSADFGRTSGGAINASVKHGTNEFHGGAIFNYTPGALEGHRRDTFTAGNQIFRGGQQDTTYEGDVYLSGPIIKDRLFFNAIFNPRATVSTGAVAQGNRTDDTARSNFFGLSIDARITDNQRVEYVFFRDSFRDFNRPFQVDPDTFDVIAPRLTLTNQAGGNNHLIKYTGNFTDWFALTTYVGFVKQSQRDFGESVATSFIQDVRNFDRGLGPIAILGPQASGGVVNSAGLEQRFEYRADLDFFFNLLGSHKLRIGFDREKINSLAQSARPGGVSYQYRFRTAGQATGADNGATFPVDGEYVRTDEFFGGGEFTAFNTASYLQDSWELLDKRLTLLLGVRYDKFVNNNRAGQPFVELKNLFAPRVGFSADPFGDGQNKIFGFYGRYYQPVPTNTSIRASGGEVFRRQFFPLISVDPVTGLPTFDATQGLGVQTLSAGTVPDPQGLSSRNLTGQFDQEYILGYQRTYGENWTFGVRGTYRKLGATVEDTDLGPILAAYCERVGRDDCASADGTFILHNPGRAQTVLVDVDGNPDTPLESITFTPEDLRNPGAQRKYWAVEFLAERKFAEKFNVRATYVVSSSKGNVEGGTLSDIAQTDTGITQSFDSPNNEVGAFGFLPNHHRHTLKIFGSYRPVERFVIGANTIFQSPRRFGCLGFAPDDVTPLDSQNLAAPSQFYCLRPDASGDLVPTLTPRGSQLKSNWLTQVDLNFGYEIPLSFGTAEVGAQIFNVFGFKNKVRLQEQGDFDPETPSQFYGAAAGYQAPRSFRFTFGYRF